jgi:UDP-N-acetylglucosamine 2-epimerase (non-hydrolysing)
MTEARLVITDSGGVQEETTALSVPCLTVRTTTERPITVTEGTNRLVSPTDPNALLTAVDAVLAEPIPHVSRPLLWDGHAAKRIVAVIAAWCERRGSTAHRP